MGGDKHRGFWWCSGFKGIHVVLGWSFIAEWSRIRGIFRGWGKLISAVNSWVGTTTSGLRKRHWPSGMHSICSKWLRLKDLDLLLVRSGLLQTLVVVAEGWPGIVNSLSSTVGSEHYYDAPWGTYQPLSLPNGSCQYPLRSLEGWAAGTHRLWGHSPGASKCLYYISRTKGLSPGMC